MSIDLNTAEEQREGGRTVPPGSIVLVQMTIRQPKAGMEGSDPFLTMARSGMEYLNCEFEVAQGSYKGQKFWDNFNVAGATTAGQAKAVEISMQRLRAIVEASRGISPKDSSPQATQNRILKSWEELNGVYFPAMLDAVLSDPSPKDGKVYVNNTLKRIITPDKTEEYTTVADGGEIITNNPLPSVDAAPVRPASPAPPAAPQYVAPPAAAPAQNPIPKWGQAPPQRASGTPF